MKKAPKFAIALIAAACVSTSAFASDTPKAQPLEKVAPYPQAEKDEASGHSVTRSAG
mgnify:CR=1 FL=1